ncbi:MAG: hypothetical protein WC427_02665 [Candidatus Paceibacterota bacterium]
MEGKEIAKFLSGFFMAGVLANLGLVFLSSSSSFKILGNIIDFNHWTILLISFFIFAIIFAFLGWGIKKGPKYISFLMVIFVIFSFYIGFDVLKIKNINLFQANLIKNSEENIILLKIEAINQNDKILNSNISFSLGSNRQDGAKDLAIDKEGNIYVAGYFQGTVNLDLKGGIFEINSLGNSLINSAVDIYVAKYSREKDLLWGFSIGSSGKDIPLALGLDFKENIYLIGYFGGLADFDPNLENEKILDAVSGRDAFLAKYNNNGKFEWAKKIGNLEKIPFLENDDRFEEARVIAFDKDNNVYLAGVFDGTINLDEPNSGNTLNTFTSKNNSRDVFIAVYNELGEYQKGFILGDTGDDEVQGLIINPDKEIYLAGSFSGKTNFDLKDKTNKKTIFSSNGNFDAFLLKYNNDFDYLWSKKWGGNGKDESFGLALNKNNEIIVAGNFFGPITIGTKKLLLEGASNVFFAIFNQNGELKIAKSFGSGSAKALKVIFDQENNIYLSGFFKTICNFSTIKENKSLIATSEGAATDAFIAKYDQEGNYLWANNLGGNVFLESENQLAEGLVIGKNNFPMIAGVFYKDIIFHSTESLDLINHGEADSFIVEYNSNGEIE